jgi:DNA modification methylase
MSGGRQLEAWPVERLRPYERNPRTHSASQLEKIGASLREFGWTNPILADADGTVIAGHGRLEAAKALGLAEVPVIVLTGLTAAQRRAYVIADNRLALEAGWDSVLLAAELEALRIEDFDLGLLGFDSAEIAKLLAPPQSNVDADPRIDEADALREKWGTATGQLWRLGAHRILCGDSTKAEDVARLMGGQLADGLWTDPPYNVDYEGAAGKIENDHMDADAFGAFLAAAFGRAFEALKPGAPAYVAHADTEGLAFRRAFVEAGFKLSACLVWRKNSLVLGRSDYHWQHEPVLYGWKPGKAHRWYGGRDKTTVIDVDRQSRSDLHPTTKPVALITAMLTNSVVPGDVVLDLFGGSGSTLIACEQIGAGARLLELDPRFVAVTLQRFVDATGGQPELEPGGSEDAA